MKIDDKDTKILSILRKNARTSNVEISKAIGLTEGAVRHRIHQLVDNGTIRHFTVEISVDAELFAIIMVKAKSETKKMMKEIQALKITKDTYEISGAYDGCIILSGSNMKEIDAKVDNIRRCSEVADTTTFISFKRW